MKTRPLVFAVTAAFLALAAWLTLRPVPPPAPAGNGLSALSTPAVTQTGEAMPSAVPAASTTGGAANGTAPVPLAGGSPGSTPGAPPTAGSGTATPDATDAATTANGPPTPEGAVTAARKVRRMIVDFHTLMGENPVGTNAEIMRAVMGGNPHQATLGPPEGQSLNDRGELVDPWGTPYFFHQLSGDHMEVHSAGPDKVMGTADDVVVK